MKHCALLTCENLDAFVHDEHLLERALSKKNWTWEWVEWKKIKQKNWSDFDLALVRTTWDYTKNLSLFLENLEWINRKGCRLINSLEAIQWNSHKSYLETLARLEVPIVKTEWVQSWRPESLKAFPDLMKSSFLVIKPQVGAGSFQTFKLTPEELSQGGRGTEVLNGQAVMIQPFMPKISEEGEFSALYFGDRLSHCILKKPKYGDFRSQEEYGSRIETVDLSLQENEFCRKILSKVDSEFFFARVDFVKDVQNNPCLMELELIEPSLYFRFQEGSADLFLESLECYI